MLKDAPDAVELQKVEGKIDIEHVGFSFVWCRKMTDIISVQILL